MLSSSHTSISALSSALLSNAHHMHLPQCLHSKRAAIIATATVGIGWMAFVSWRKWKRQRQLCSEAEHSSEEVDAEKVNENHVTNFSTIDSTSDIMGQQNSSYLNPDGANHISYNKVSNSESLDVNTLIDNNTTIDDNDDSVNSTTNDNDLSPSTTGSDDDVGCLSSLSLGGVKPEKAVLIHQTSQSEKRQELNSASSAHSSHCSVDSRNFNRRNLHTFKKVIVRSRNDGEEKKAADIFVTDEINTPANEKNRQKNPIYSAVINKQPSLMSSNGFSYQQYQNSLLEKLNSLYGTNKLITDEDAKCLVLLLQQKNDDTLLKTVTTMCNLAAFTVNQDLFRQHGAADLMVNLLDDQDISSSVRLMLTQCIGNMAVNVKNHSLLQRSVSRIIESFVSDDCSELQKIICIQTLINLSVEISQQNAPTFIPAIPVALERLWSSLGPNISCLKLLINFSCDPSLANQILASKAPDNFVNLLSPSNNEDILIRSLTLFCYLFSTVEMLNLPTTTTKDDFNKQDDSLPQNLMQPNLIKSLSKNLHTFDASSKDLEQQFSKNSIYQSIFGDQKGREAVQAYTLTLLSHKNEEIAEKSQRLSRYMTNICESNTRNMNGDVSHD